MTATTPKTIPDYLEQLRAALAGADPALIQDALYDAEEYLGFFGRVMASTGLPVAIQNAPQYLGRGLSDAEINRLRDKAKGALGARHNLRNFDEVNRKLEQLYVPICVGTPAPIHRRQAARWRAALRYLESPRSPPSVMPDPVAFPARWWAHLSPVPKRMPPFPLRPRALAPVRLDCF